MKSNNHSSQPKVTIVIVNWNKCKDLLRLLDSIAVLEYENLDIVIVDNASVDNSVASIKNLPITINLLINHANLGGTGGFNSGIRFALQHCPCKYLWLLDNDATVSPKALKALVAAMESDPVIGLAGSRVLNAKNPEFIVETGAVFSWKSGTVRPVERNITKSVSIHSDLIDVDYVAVCSALARVSALVDVGLMDERYFLFWDDMDWGVAFRDAGFRVVAVPESEVFHPAFTEYRSLLVDSYYGVRNQLLTFSKFKHYKGATLGLYNMLRRLAKGTILMKLTSKPGAMLGLCGFWDFLRSRWGKFQWRPFQQVTQKEGMAVVLPARAKVLVIPTRDAADTAQALEHLALIGVTEIDVLVATDRKELFAGLTGCHLLLVDYAQKLATIGLSKFFLKLLFAGYDYAIILSPERASPFTFVAKKSAYYDAVNRCLIATSESIWHSWKVVIAFIGGEAAGMLLFGCVWLRGFSLIRRKT